MKAYSARSGEAIDFSQVVAHPHCFSLSCSRATYLYKCGYACACAYVCTCVYAFHMRASQVMLFDDSPENIELALQDGVNAFLVYRPGGY